MPEGTTYDFMAHLSAQTGQDRHLPVHNKKKNNVQRTIMSYGTAKPVSACASS